MSPRHRTPPGNSDLDPLLLDPTRLAIVSLLGSAQWCEFGFVRDTVQLTDPALSKQVTTLSREDYVEVRKGYVGKKPRTWLQASPTGRKRLARHLAALQAIVDGAQAAGAAHDPVLPPPDSALSPPDLDGPALSPADLAGPVLSPTDLADDPVLQPPTATWPFVKP